MNILHVKYAVEVARSGSISKAAERLLIAQPNISRSIKELEADLGITIFDRSAKGMFLTPEGSDFILHAQGLLMQIEHLENLYKDGAEKKQKFSVSVPRACYISEAFVQFSKNIGGDAAEIYYKETNSKRTIQNVLSQEYQLGIIRYAENFDHYFKAMLEEKGLNYELITEFSYCLITGKNNPLANKTKITYEDLSSFIEIAHADPYVPSLPLARVMKEELPDTVDRRIFVFERASEMELLSENPETFMWVSPTPPKLLDRYQLVQKDCIDNRRVYRDVLIFQKGYRLSKLDQLFLNELHESKRKLI